MKESSIRKWLQVHFEFQCRDCRGTVGVRSRCRNFFERYILPIVLLQPVRCERCFRRDYRIVLMPGLRPSGPRTPVTAKHAA